MWLLKIRVAINAMKGRTLLVLLLLLGWANQVVAHEVRPAYLEIIQSSPTAVSVTWKQPVRGDRRLKIDPLLPESCGPPKQNRVSHLGGTLVQRWQASCDLSQGTVYVDGLDRTLTDVFVRISFLDGETLSTVLRPGDPPLDLAEPAPQSGNGYLRLGVEHILFGYDHLLFVLGLFLLVKTRQLVATITAFTAAHSLTLGLSALGGWNLPSGPVEIVIALSISLLGLEALYRVRGRRTLSARLPWLIALGFGLIHGFGFAGALADIGLPKDAELWALLLFNLGVEVGQLAFIGALLALQWIASQVATVPARPIQIATCYALGCMGGFWALERAANTYF